MTDFTSTARALALPVGRPPSPPPYPRGGRRASSPTWSRRRSLSRSSSRPQSTKDRWISSAGRLWRSVLRTWFQFTPLQRAGFVVLGAMLVTVVILFLIFGERIFGFLEPVARKWRDTPGAWTILWLITFLVSFPPMIGYSTAVTLAGFVYGMKGWFIASTATIAGSTASFIVSRSILRGFVERLVGKDKRFAALSLVLKHDGLKLLIMIRLCPLPYSLSNGAISTIPTVTWQNFMLATAVASPKLLLHVFVGSRIGAIAEGGDKMDAKTKAISYVSIAIGVCAGVATGYFMYTRTKARAAQLEEEEAAAAISGRRTADGRSEYIDDMDDRAAVDVLRDSADDISLLPAHGHHYVEEVEDGYRDEFTDDEDSHDVYAHSDGGNGEIGRKAEK